MFGMRTGVTLPFSHQNTILKILDEFGGDITQICHRVIRCLIRMRQARESYYPPKSIFLNKKNKSALVGDHFTAGTARNHANPILQKASMPNFAKWSPPKHSKNDFILSILVIIIENYIVYDSHDS